MRLALVSRTETESWSKGASLFNSCKVNERPCAANRTWTANGFDHEPDRSLFIATALSRCLRDTAVSWRRIAVARAPADGCLSRSFAAHSGDHHPMAGARCRGNGAADHRSGRT